MKATFAKYMMKTVQLALRPNYDINIYFKLNERNNFDFLIFKPKKLWLKRSDLWKSWKHTVSFF